MLGLFLAGCCPPPAPLSQPLAGPMPPAVRSGAAATHANATTPKRLSLGPPQQAEGDGPHRPPPHLGARPARQISAVVLAQRPRARACYDAAQAEARLGPRDLVVAFVIATDGSVRSAHVEPEAGRIQNPELNRCVLEVVRSLAFGRSSRGLESRVRYPFHFNAR